MKRAILFRFHDRFDVCRNRLQHLHALNPGTPVYGLYGGDSERLNEAASSLQGLLQHVYAPTVPTESWLYSPEGRRAMEGELDRPSPRTAWNWLHSDLAARAWYRDFGHTQEFDVLHIIEWDLLLLEPLDTLFTNVPRDAVALTGLTPLAEVEDSWYWTTHEPWMSQWKELLAWARARGYDQQPFACVGPGATMPKEFLDRCSRIDVPELCHDELRFPLVAQLMRATLADTKFREKAPFEDESAETAYFNCHGVEIQPATVEEERSKPTGRRVFHPFRKVYPFN